MGHYKLKVVVKICYKSLMEAASVSADQAIVFY